MKKAAKPTNTTDSSISKAELLWMGLESTRGAEKGGDGKIGSPSYIGPFYGEKKDDNWSFLPTVHLQGISKKTSVTQVQF